MSYVPFAEVKALTTIEVIADWLRLKPSRNRMKCPVNDGDPRELVLFPETQTFCCFGCKAAGRPKFSGDLIELTAHVNQVPQKQAALAIQKQFTGYEPAKKGLPQNGFDDMDYTHERIASLGISPEKAQELGIGYRDKGTTRRSVLFPLRDTTGKLLGYVIHSENGTIKLPTSLKDKVQ